MLPVFGVAQLDSSRSIEFEQWPTQINGVTLNKLPLTDNERRFNNGFPGNIARFTDGRREYVIRWITAVSRKVHPASDCFRGIGYALEPLPLVKDEQGSTWGSFMATKNNTVLKVDERIYDEAGNSWTDISSWYWAALFAKTEGPWWAMTVAERLQQN
ncbi:hypothetical protein [Kaarinaea lacus]